MHVNLSDSDIEFLETLYNPIAMTECLFPENIKAPHTWNDPETKCITLRNYQFPMTNYSYMYADDFEKTDKQNFQARIGAGKLINIASRNIGKSYLLIVDVLLNFIHSGGDEACIASFDFKHLKKICTPIANFVNYHAFMKLFKRSGTTNVRFSGGGMEADSLTGHVLYGKNEKADSGDDAGTDFHGLHTKYLGYEEASYMTDKGTEKRIDSVHSHGCIERLSGIPDLRIGSPLGNILSNIKNKFWTCRLPQYVREDWDIDTEEEQAEKYNGRETMGYRLNVEGELIEGASGFWDMERLKKASRYGNRGSKIKNFEIGKRNFHQHEQLLAIDRLPCEQVYACADIGMGNRPTEIVIIFFDGKKYIPVYNITLNKLIAKEQAEIFKFIYTKLGTCFMGLDCTTDFGIAQILKDDGIPSEHLVEAKLNTNIEIGFEKDGQGHVKLNNQGYPLIKEENSIQWAMNRLEHLFYGGHIEQPDDDKFEREFSGFIIKKMGLRPSYGSSTTDDYHQAYQVFALTQWDNEFNQLKNNTKPKKRCLGIIE